MASFLSTLFGGGAEAEAADKDRAAAQLYQGQSLGALQSGYNTGTGAINQGVSAYTPLANLGATYGQAAPAQMAALGIGSPEAVAAAQQNFQNTPGFQAMLDNAAQASGRQSAMANMGSSGNANIQQILGAAGLTNQQYQQYMQNLGQAGQMGINATGTAAAGQAGQYDALANLAQTYAGNQSGVYGNTMQTDVGANNLQAAGEAAGAKNLLGAGLSLASLGMGGGGLMGLTGGMGSSLFGAGSGGTGLIGNVAGSSPAYGGGNILSGDAWGGSSYNRLPGLTSLDYGAGY
jgi:hypothetical protein